MRTEKVGGSSRIRSRDCRWISPPTGSFKSSVDGARNPSSGFASSAAVTMDEHDEWLWRIEGILRGVVLNKLSFGPFSMDYNLHGISNGKR